ncbi:hypothetical protein M404DRAFT_1002978 [Pisolithus tinctorius Marx 270]|uniref:Uncharacterized protein n=2 Tax=Pisolithus tinctorius Marx 270 TaxID=870435 RepID=A0A0C3P2M6_PISTI|nr:hypothetical protein M404DRAFT_1002978 [Pisolithus tinctorius Marx 270]
MSSIHRRKSSKEDDSDEVVNLDVDVTSNSNIAVTPPTPSRSRARSSPKANLPLGPGIQGRPKPPPQPLGAGIPARRPPSVSLNSPPTSPFSVSFAAAHTRAHSRTRSISSGPFVSPLPSPLQSSFTPAHVPLFPFPTSNTVPELNVMDADTNMPDTRALPPGHTRRHSRLHSRNLSIFFPRPHATISEDDRPEDEEAPAPPPEPLIIPTAHSENTLAPGRSRGELDTSFSFGGVPKSDSTQDSTMGGFRMAMKSRRGHHHQHSLSHSFFSFLEPGTGQKHVPAVPNKLEDLHTTPTPTPISPWTPISNASLFAPSSNLSAPELIPRSQSKSPGATSSLSDSPSSSSLPASSNRGVSRSGRAAAATAVVQFLLGAFLWAHGQSIGSLACTGLGYWVVFDAVGVAGPPLIAYHASAVGSGMYGPARSETTLLFAQCVYLMFAGVYVAKEAVEHLLLAAGSNAHAHGHGSSGPNSGDGHHHHWGDERPENLGLRFPVFLVLLALLTLAGTTTVFGQHDVLVDITNKHIPSPLEFFQRHHHVVSPRKESTSPIKRLVRNPYALPPILFCMAILVAELVLDVAHYAPFDLGLASLQVVVMIHVAYAACVVLGGVLLQTAPSMVSVTSGGIRGPGKMEAFWRAVREIERHEHVVHLPAPHVWQVIPAGQPRSVECSIRPRRHTITNNHAHHDHDRSHGHNGHNQLVPHHDLHNCDHDPQIRSDDSDLSPTLIVTISPVVRKDLPDSEVLALTQWASSRVYGAFGYIGSGSLGTNDRRSEISGVEVTVGVVRG